MKFNQCVLVLLMASLFMACNSNSKNEAKSAKPKAETETISETKTEPKSETKSGLIPDSWIANRVEKAKASLNKSAAGKLVWQAMEAHGGLAKWYSNGPINFQFDYQPRGKGAVRNTIQLIDTWSNRAVHTKPDDPTAKFGWDGKDAWVTKKDTASFEFNLRFWALTPIYFLAQPFNFDGAGVKLEKLADKELDGVTFDAVKISFESGTGDAPDDYYINYYDKKSHELKALRYIVSYPKYFKNGGNSPEKIMTLHDFTTVDGIRLPTSYKTYMLSKEEGKGEHVTDITVSKIKFVPQANDTNFEIPKGAHIIDGL